MCGRTACTLAPDDVCRACLYRNNNGTLTKPQWKDPPGGQKYYPSYNLAPSAHSPVLISSRHVGVGTSQQRDGLCTDLIVQPMQWGLVPRWHQGEDATSFGYKMNNARSDGLMDKVSFKKPLEAGQRCVVLADGYFEWNRVPGAIQPYYVYFDQHVGKMNDDHTGSAENKPHDTLTKQSADVRHDEIKRDDLQEDVKKCKMENNCQLNEGQSSANSAVHSDAAKIAKTVKEERFDNVEKRIGTEICKGDANCNKTGESQLGTLDLTATGDSDIWSGRKLLTMAGLFDIWHPKNGSGGALPVHHTGISPFSNCPVLFSIELFNATSSEDGPLYSYAMITVDAHPSIAWMHDRMPAVLNGEEEIKQWLNCDLPFSKVSSLVRPVDSLVWHPVSSLVNNSRNKSPDCIVKIDLVSAQKDKKPAKSSAESSFMKSWLGKAKSPDDKPDSGNVKKPKLE